MARSEKIVQQELSDVKRDHWERLKRNPNYIADYNRFQQMKDSKKRAFFLLEIFQKYSLSDLLDPQKPFSDEMAAKINLASAYLKLKCHPILSPVHESSFQAHTFDEVSKKTNYRMVTREEALIDGKYLQVLIDIDLPDKQIRQIASNAAELAKNLLKNNNKQTRGRYKENLKAYEVWDKRRERKTFAEIGIEIYKDFSSEAEDRARKAFLRAHELVLGRSYKPQEKKIIRKEELLKTCGTCRDKACLKNLKFGKNWIPCPDILPYVEQDQVTLREKIL